MSPVRIVTGGAADLPDGLADDEFWRTVRAGDPAPSTGPPGREAFVEGGFLARTS
jgi:hypothetical protein